MMHFNTVTAVVAALAFTQGIAAAPVLQGTSDLVSFMNLKFSKLFQFENRKKKKIKISFSLYTTSVDDDDDDTFQISYHYRGTKY